MGGARQPKCHLLTWSFWLKARQIFYHPPAPPTPALWSRQGRWPLTCLILLLTQSLSPPVTHLALSPAAPLLGHARPRGVFSGRGRPPATRLSSAAQHEAGRLDVRVAIASCIGVRGYFGLSWIGAIFDGSPLPSRLRIRPLVCMRRTFVGEKAQIKTSMHDPTNTNLPDWLCPLIALDPDP